MVTICLFVGYVGNDILFPVDLHEKGGDGVNIPHAALDLDGRDHGRHVVTVVVVLRVTLRTVFLRGPDQFGMFGIFSQIS